MLKCELRYLWFIAGKKNEVVCLPYVRFGKNSYLPHQPTLMSFSLYVTSLLLLHFLLPLSYPKINVIILYIPCSLVLDSYNILERDFFFSFGKVSEELMLGTWWEHDGNSDSNNGLTILIVFLFNCIFCFSFFKSIILNTF